VGPPHTGILCKHQLAKRSVLLCVGGCAFSQDIVLVFFVVGVGWSQCTPILFVGPDAGGNPCAEMPIGQWQPMSHQNS